MLSGMARLQVNQTAYTGRQFRSTLIYAEQPDTTLGQLHFDVGKWAPLVNTKDPNHFFIYVDDNFSVSYSCQQVGPMRMELAFISSRERFPENLDENMQRLEHVLKSEDVGLKLDFVDQTKCPSIEENTMREEIREVENDEERSHEMNNRLLALLQNRLDRVYS